MSQLIEVKNLVVRYGQSKTGFLAVDDVSFVIPQGQTVGLVGESGSGKTTVARAIAGIGPFSEGDIRYKEQSLSALKRKEKQAFKKEVQMIFQNPYESLNPRLQVIDLIAEGSDNFGLTKNAEERKQKVAKLLHQVGLPQDALYRYPHEFSGGQRQRIVIARALALEPKFLLLDEPISALDVSIQAQIVNLLRKIQKEQNLTYLFIAHDLAMVRHISDYVVVMYRGKVVEAGDARTIYQNPQHPYTKALLSAVPSTDPIKERQKELLIYQPAEQAQNFVQVNENHWVLQAVELA
ncbi:MAG: oligopeptide/dipeptide ABC transporter ATP-binding protein [Enterococcus sp.]